MGYSKGKIGKPHLVRISYDAGGNKIKATSAKDAEQKITELYANKPFIANGQIKVFVDVASGRARFVDALRQVLKVILIIKQQKKLKG